MELRKKYLLELNKSNWNELEKEGIGIINWFNEIDPSPELSINNYYINQLVTTLIGSAVCPESYMI